MPALHLRCCACASGPRVVHEDAHVACVWKPSGVALRDAERSGPNRVAPPLETWAQRGGVAASREPDAQPPRVASAAERSVGGLVLLSKTARAAAALSRPAALRCAYVAVVAPQHAPSANTPQLPPGVRFEGGARPAPGRLAMVRVEADASRRPLADVAAALAAAGLPVLGVPAAAGVAGGAHLALVQLSLPTSLAALRGASAPTAFDVDTPAKLAKALRRDALRGERLQAQEAAANDDDEASSSSNVVVSFMGLRLRIGGDQLRPRASSAAVVEAAVAAFAAAGGADAPRVLDLGTGCGALLLATLAALPAGASGCGVDLDAAALRYARANADAAFGADASSARVTLLRADFGQLHAPAVRAALAPGGYHALLCNPPYLRDADGDGRVTPEARRALYGGPDGDAAYAALASSLAAAQPPLLAPGGVVALQLPGAAGAARVAGIAAHFARAGFSVAAERRDQRGVLRCLLLTQHAAAQ